ncbi:hypothetical protein F4X88_03760 [Candidatus Poribacteria bacterium]|nr:hypothetical protein [Candidatus Poribacteria bacterium]MYA55391.1 hypothetical protein [Candidatus Poribacteria bacterium]
MKKWAFSILLLLSFSIAGCAGLQGKSGTEILPSRLTWLQDTPIEEIASSRLTCDTHPEIVDGNLETVGTFEVRGAVEKKYDIVEGESGFYGKNQYVTELDGTIRCEILIKLEKPMYVSSVEVYPASPIPTLALSTALDESERHFGESGTGFKPVHDKQYEDVEGTKPVKFQVERELLYLRVTADAVEDRQDATRFDDSVSNEGIDIPLKGASIREIKLYGQQPLYSKTEK